ncbi:MAG TPA: hypothetical protein ENJ32_05545 [Crenotrichaceae bacterium]|nr:hypothetical protein [Crenotrichaceae bacterium]
MHIRLTLLVTLLLSSTITLASGQRRYEVSITNLTKGQSFTPQLVTMHTNSVRLFTLGEPASSSLELLAEGGDTAPLTADLNDLSDKVGEVATIPGLLTPGQTATVEISGRRRHRFLSFAAMLIPTNDTFVALNRMRLPHRGSVSYTALAYDSGTEENNQICVNIPGPRCLGEGHSPGPNDTDEGFVYVSNGFHDLGKLDAEGNEILGPLEYDWRNPVALVTVKRLR